MLRLRTVLTALTLSALAVMVAAPAAQAATRHRPHHAAPAHHKPAPPPRPAFVLGTLDALDTSTTPVTGTVTVAVPGDNDGDADDVATTRSVKVSFANLDVWLDGAAAPGGLAVGQYLAVFGTCAKGSVTATAVYGWSTLPTVTTGRITGVTGTTVTFSNHGTPTTVDLATTPTILLNGTATTGDLLPVGARIVVLADQTTTPATTLAAFAFARGHHAHH